MAVSNPARFSSIKTEAGSTDNNFSHYYRGGTIISTNWSVAISTTAAGLAMSQFSGAVQPTRNTSRSTSFTTTFTTSVTTMEWTYGCVIAGTRILLPDGSTKLIEELTVRDELASVMVPGLQPETVEDYEDYHSATFDGAERTVTQVASIYSQWISVIYEVKVKGGERVLQVTPEHPFLIRDEFGIYRFCTAEELEMEHRLIGKDLQLLEIESLEPKSGNFLYYKLDCAPYDLFIHEDIVGHNLKPGDTNPMDHQTAVVVSHSTSRATTRTTTFSTDI